MRICRACGATRDFYKSIGTFCKTCWKTRMRAHRQSNLAHYRAYDKARNQSQERRETFAEKQRQKRAHMGPAYLRAHNAVRRAVLRGLLTRPGACSRCATDCRPQAHHDDYAAPLAVLWLCPPCHAARHVELGRVG